MENKQYAHNSACSGKTAEEKARKIKRIAASLRRTGHEEIASDVMGSYTGTPIDGGTPVQDADDL